MNHIKQLSKYLVFIVNFFTVDICSLTRLLGFVYLETSSKLNKVTVSEPGLLVKSINEVRRTSHPYKLFLRMTLDCIDFTLMTLRDFESLIIT